MLEEEKHIYNQNWQNLCTAKIGEMCNVKVNLIAKVPNHSPGKAYAGQHPCKGKIFKNIKFAFFFLHILCLGPCCLGVEYPFQELARSGKLEQYVCSVNAKISNLKSWVYGFLISPSRSYSFVMNSFQATLLSISLIGEVLFVLSWVHIFSRNPDNFPAVLNIYR